MSAFLSQFNFSIRHFDERGHLAYVSFAKSRWNAMQRARNTMFDSARVVNMGSGETVFNQIPVYFVCALEKVRHVRCGHYDHTTLLYRNESDAIAAAKRFGGVVVGTRTTRFSRPANLILEARIDWLKANGGDAARIARLEKALD